jgi:hypothetical protein
MQSQRTISDRFTLTGIEPAGGNPVQITFSPLPPNKGIVFSNSKVEVPLQKENIYATSPFSPAQTIILRKGKKGFMNIEHFIATFLAYGIDNIGIYTDKEHSLTSYLFQYFGNARNIEVMPYLPDCQKSLCNKIEEVGIEEQNEKRKTLRMKVDRFDGKDGKLIFEKIDREGVIINSLTEYYLINGDVVKGSNEIELIPKEYKPISSARSFCGAALRPPSKDKNSRKTGFFYGASVYVPKFVIKSLGSFLYFSYGIGHGVDETNIFYPPRSEAEWRYKENIKDEVAAHTNIDRAGDVFAVLQAIFQARPTGIKLTSRFAGHRYAIETIKNNLDKFYIES